MSDTVSPDTSLPLPAYAYYHRVSSDAAGNLDCAPSLCTTYVPGRSVALATEHSYAVVHLLPLFSSPATAMWVHLVRTYAPSSKDAKHPVLPRLFKCEEQGEILRVRRLPIAALPSGAPKHHFAGRGHLARELFDAKRVIPLDPAADDDLKKALSAEDMEILLELRAVVVDLQLLVHALDEIAPCDESKSGPTAVDRTRLLSPEKPVELLDVLERVRAGHSDRVVAGYMRYQRDSVSAAEARALWTGIHAAYRERFPHTPDLNEIDLSADDLFSAMQVDVSLAIARISADYEACAEKCHDPKVIRLLDCITPRLFATALRDTLSHRLNFARDDIVSVAIEMSRLSEDREIAAGTRTAPIEFPDPRAPTFVSEEYVRNLVFPSGPPPAEAEAAADMARLQKKLDEARYLRMIDSAGQVATWYYRLMLLWAMRGLFELDADGKIFCVADTASAAVRNAVIAIPSRAGNLSCVDGLSVMDATREKLYALPEQTKPATTEEDEKKENVEQIFEDKAYPARAVDALLFAHRFISRVNQLKASEKKVQAAT